MDQPFYMSTEEVAAFFGKSQQTILNWRKKKPAFPAPAIKSCPLQYRRTDILNYAETSRE